MDGLTNPNKVNKTITMKNIILSMNRTKRYVFLLLLQKKISSPPLVLFPWPFVPPQASYPKMNKKHENHIS